MQEHKPFAPASEKNKTPILQALKELLGDRERRVLEVGSGTGQHAVHFAQAMPALEWFTSDLTAQHAGIEAWIQSSGLGNVHGPFVLDVASKPWPDQILKLRADTIFSANTAHIMPLENVLDTLDAAGVLLPADGLLIWYGPFQYAGEHTAPSNAAFDTSLRAQDPRMGVRDASQLEAHARNSRLELERDIAMPSNNRLLVWRKLGAAASITPGRQ